MRQRLASVVLHAALAASLGCGSSPTAPTPASAAEFDPAPLFASLAGPYTLTIEADESCAVPSSLQVLNYDVWLERTRFRYLGVRVPGKDFVGDLWARAREDQGLELRWNVDCEAADTVGSTAFYLCGQGSARATNGTISGVLVGAYRPFCAAGSHRFAFRPRR